MIPGMKDVLSLFEELTKENMWGSCIPRSEKIVKSLVKAGADTTDIHSLEISPKVRSDDLTPRTHQNEDVDWKLHYATEYMGWVFDPAMGSIMPKEIYFNNMFVGLFSGLINVERYNVESILRLD